MWGTLVTDHARTHAGSLHGLLLALDALITDEGLFTGWVGLMGLGGGQCLC